MKIALVHDYLSEFGGAERVLKVLSEMYPKAPIYTAFVVEGSRAQEEFKNRKVIESSFAPLLKFGKLYSPLRFLIPLIWKSINLSKYDLVITSSSGYIARGFVTSEKTKVVCYCHTPPRFLYGYQTSLDIEKYWPVKIYATVVNHILRIFDYYSSQEVDVWIANSENVKARITKFYRKDSTVIYPPIEVKEIKRQATNKKKSDYFLIASRLVGAKGLEEAAEAANRLGFKLWIVGESAGFSKVKERIQKLGGENVELLGRVSDQALYKLYAEAQGFLALARNEDFGMTVVESQAAGTAVIAFNGGGFRESVINGKTGILIDDTRVKDLEEAMKKFNRIKWDKKKIQENAERFSRENFEKQIRIITRSEK